MKVKSRYWMLSICLWGILIGRILNRVLTRYYGKNASNIVIEVIIAGCLCIILFVIGMRRYYEAFVLFIMIIPLIVSGIGMYLDKIGLEAFGILLIFIIYPILILVLKKHRNK